MVSPDFGDPSTGSVPFHQHDPQFIIPIQGTRMSMFSQSPGTYGAFFFVGLEGGFFGPCLSRWELGGASGVKNDWPQNLYLNL